MLKGTIISNKYKSLDEAIKNLTEFKFYRDQKTEQWIKLTVTGTKKKTCPKDYFIKCDNGIHFEANRVMYQNNDHTENSNSDMTVSYQLEIYFFDNNGHRDIIHQSAYTTSFKEENSNYELTQRFDDCMEQVKYYVEKCYLKKSINCTIDYPECDPDYIDDNITITDELLQDLQDLMDKTIRDCGIPEYLLKPPKMTQAEFYNHYVIDHFLDQCKETKISIKDDYDEKTKIALIDKINEKIYQAFVNSIEKPIGSITYMQISMKSTIPTLNDRKVVGEIIFESHVIDYYMVTYINSCVYTRDEQKEDNNPDSFSVILDNNPKIIPQFDYSKDETEVEPSRFFVEAISKELGERVSEIWNLMRKITSSEILLVISTL